MEIGGFLLILVVAIALLMLMLLKLRFHPLLALFLVSVFIGLGLGKSLPETISLINSNFGGTLSAIGVAIIFGAVIAMGIQDSGAATGITNFFIRRFGGRRLELAPSLSTFIMSIPVFGDISAILVAPLAAAIAKRKKLSMSLTAMMTIMASSLTHGLVPPTPGILAVSVLLGADLGLVIIWGVVASFLALAACYLTLRGYCNREYIPPREDFSRSIEPAPDDAGVEDLVIRGGGESPSPLCSFLPLLVPVLFISSGTLSNMLLPEGNAVRGFANMLADRSVALFAGVVVIALVGYRHCGTVVRNALINSGRIAADAPAASLDDLAGKTPYLRVCFDNWIGRALLSALGPLLVTAMGGAMGGILRTSPAIAKLGEAAAASGLHGALVPFMISAILMTVCGSQTVASMTTAGLVVNMLPALAISPVVCAVVIGAGSMVGYHLNNSGFWVSIEFYGLTTRQGLRYITLPAAVCGVSAFLVMLAASLLALA